MYGDDFGGGYGGYGGIEFLLLTFFDSILNMVLYWIGGGSGGYYFDDGGGDDGGGDDGDGGGDDDSSPAPTVSGDDTTPAPTISGDDTTPAPTVSGDDGLGDDGSGRRRSLLVEPFKRCKKTEKEYKILLSDSGGDGWEGNVLTFDDFKTEAKSFTLSSGSNGTAKVCLKDGNYKPYACGGKYPSEVSWTWVVDEVKDTRSGTVLTPAASLTGGAGNKCLNKASGSITYTVVVNPAESNVPTFQPTPTPTHAPIAANQPSQQPTPTPTRVPTLVPSPAPFLTPSPQPTEDHLWEFGLKQYVLYKYYEEMDPIECAKVNGSDYCWVQGNRGKKGTKQEYLGAMLFPIIQHFNEDCYNCSSTATNNPKVTCVCNIYILSAGANIIFCCRLTVIRSAMRQIWKFSCFSIQELQVSPHLSKLSTQLSKKSEGSTRSTTAA